MKCIKKIQKQDIDRQMSFSKEPSKYMFGIDVSDKTISKNVEFINSTKPKYKEEVTLNVRSGEGKPQVMINKGLKEIILDKLEGNLNDIIIFENTKKDDVYSFHLVKSGSPDYDAYETILGKKTQIVFIDDEPPIGESPINKPHNRLVYGAPGTGKSYKLKKDSSAFGGNMKRITFYPDYSYSKFVGSYKPVSNKKKTSKFATSYKSISKDNTISYEFVPGPFLEAVKKSKDNKDGKGIPYLLIIEEINRANAASVFGEVFQLLDRDNGVSEYGITLSTEAQQWLLDNGIIKSLDEELKLNNKLYIWATMNSADQGVFPLDAAFKRRWKLEGTSINDEDSIKAIADWEITFLGKKYSWNTFRTEINEQLSSEKIGANEDKLIGPFFLKEEELDDDSVIKNKLIHYLRENVVRHNPTQLFNAEYAKSFSKILDAGKEDKIFTFGLTIASDKTPSPENNEDSSSSESDIPNEGEISNEEGNE
ncbi:AAA family ATPase [Flammeovirga sp. SubArs3]|uniref:AAA family ATPase n=1 Tax=Flammeovirga sp. SubArs3 TaxID=2995316 RepID=UPI00248B96C5|nr:AAA family ATPase [Flammeovirga sp. SubArs3]